MNDTSSLMMNAQTAVSSFNVPVNHSRPKKPIVFEKRLRLAELILRVSICGSSALAALIVATDSQVREIFSVQEKATYRVMKSFVFLVVVNGILASYSLLQVVRCALSMSKGIVIFSKPLACAIFSVDQGMAYISFAALAAALQSSAIAKMGQSELQWIKLCGMFGKYCNQEAGGIVFALIGCLCAAIISSISGYGLFRLFRGNKGEISGSCPADPE
ncbi:hypothetical protein V2J09_003270 [Rumex salicifolius]